MAFAGGERGLDLGGDVRRLCRVLDEVVHGAEVETTLDVGVLPEVAEDDDGDVLGPWIALQSLERLESAHAGHDEVEQDEVECLRADDVEALESVRGLEHLVALLGELVGVDAAEEFGVLDHQHRFACHGSLPFVAHGQFAGTYP
jgi:hypothetical protein